MTGLHLYLGNKNYSSWSLRAWLVLKQTGAPFTETVIPLCREESPERLRHVSPSRRVPVLEHGNLVIWESLDLPMDMRARHLKHLQNRDVTADIERIVNIWSDCRARFGIAGDFLFGPYTIADAMYAPVVSRFITYDVVLKGVVARYRDAVWEWPPLQDWLEAAAAGPWVNDTL